MPPGKYTIEVAAVNPKGRSEWLTGKFTVGRGGLRIAGLSAIAVGHDSNFEL